MMNISAQNKFNELIDKGGETSEYLKAYVETQVELKKIEASKIASKSLSKTISTAVTAVLLSGVFLFLMTAFAIFISQQLGSYIYGFLAIAGLVFLVYLIFLLVKKPLVDATAKKKVGQAIFGDKIPEPTAEQHLKAKAKQLETYIERTAKELPQTVKSLQANDFVPENVQLKGTAEENRNLKNIIVQNAINSALKAIKQKLTKK